MNLYKKIPLNFEGKEYEIRVFYDNSIVNVVPFLNNYPANGFRHQMQFPKKYDIESMLNKGAADELVEMSKYDILEKRWETVLDIANQV